MSGSSSTNDELFYKSLVESYVDKAHNPRFVERHWLRKQVEAKLALPNCRFVLLTAEPGAGKSAFMAWLAHLNPNWCRYFIRRDQRTPLGDPGAHSFLLQTGFQLAATHPDAFNQEQVKITVAQRIGQAEDSEIVGVEIGKLFASPFYQKVVQIQQEVSRSGNSTVAGIRISEWYADSRSVPLTNLQFMAMFDPASTLLKQNNQQQIVVLVDALDELRYRDPELSLLKWLADCPELPANLRFVLTSRLDDGLLNHFRGAQQPYLQELEIGEEDPEVTNDLTQYAYQLVATEPKVQETLAQLERDTATFARQAVEKANGNFGYLSAIGRAVDQAIHQEQLDLLKELLNLSQLPGTLQELYLVFLTKIKKKIEDEKETVVVEDAEGNIGFLPAWAAVYKPILSVLSVALEPLSLTQIQKLGPVRAEYDYVVRAIEKLRQFLDQISNSYRLYHATLPEFLTSPKTKENSESSFCYVDAVKQNQRIVNFYQAGKQSWTEVDLAQIAKDDYGQRHLAQHLVKANLVEELHLLLSLEKDGKNAWFKAKDDEGHTDSFLADLELAWAQADEAYDREPGKSTGLQCRYALMRASINRLSVIPTELTVALIKHNYWKPAKALAYARQIPDLQERCDSLIALAVQLPDSEPLKHQVFQIALKTIQSIQDENSRARTLRALVAHLPSELLPQTLNIAQSIRYDGSRARVLMALADKIPIELLPKALITLGIMDAFNDAAISIELFEKLSPNRLLEVLPEALESASSIHTQEPLQVLTVLFTKLSSEALPQALEVALSIDDCFSRTRVLTVLGDRLPEAFPKALEAALSIQGEEYRAQVLTVLGDRLPEALLPQALEVALSIQGEEYRAQVLTALGDRLPEAFPKALEAALSIQGEEYRAQVLAVLGDKLPEALPKALEAALSIYSVSGRAQALTVLADKLPEALPKALEAALSIENAYYRIQALMALIDELPEDKLFEVLPKALEAAQFIEDGNYCVRVLTVLAEKQTGAFLQALDAAQSIYNEVSRAQALIPLIDKLPSELLLKALDVAQSIQCENSCVEVLTALINKLPLELLPQVLAPASSIQDKRYCAQVLMALGDRLPEALPKALETALLIENADARTQVLMALGDRLPEALPKALETALSIQDEISRTQVLIMLSNKLSSKLLLEALDTALSIENAYHRAQALTALGDKLPEVLPTALNTALSIQNKEYRAQALTALGNKLPEVLPTALDAALSIYDETSRAHVLTALGDKIPEALPTALDTALSIDDDYYRAQALILLINKLSSELLLKVLDAALSIQREDSCAEVLTALINKLPTELLPKALDATQSIQSDFPRAQALMLLASKLPLEMLLKASNIALSIQREDSRVQALTALVRELPSELLSSSDLLSKVLNTVQSIQNKEYCAQAFTALGDKLPEVLPKALEAALSIDDDYSRAQALTKLVDKMPEALPKALEAAQSVQNEDSRTQVLTNLSFHLAYAPNRFILWKNLLHFLSHRLRPQLLKDMESLTPVLLALGGETAAEETTQAIQDVGHWWK